MNKLATTFTVSCCNFGGSNWSFADQDKLGIKILPDSEAVDLLLTISRQTWLLPAEGTYRVIKSDTLLVD
jgi:hypothetical protein